MVEEVLRILNAEVSYSVDHLPSRIKMLIDNPPHVKNNVLHRLHESGYRLKVDVKERQLHVEIPKSVRKRKRVETIVPYEGKMDSMYTIGKGEHVLRYLLGVTDLCDFDVSVDTIGNERHIYCKNIECIDYAVVAHAAKDIRVEFDFPNTQIKFILDNMS